MPLIINQYHVLIKTSNFHLLHLFKNKVPLHRRFDKKHLITGYYKNDIDHFIINHSPNNKIITNTGRKLKSIPKQNKINYRKILKVFRKYLIRRIKYTILKDNRIRKFREIKYG